MNLRLKKREYTSDAIGLFFSFALQILVYITQKQLATKLTITDKVYAMHFPV